MLTGYFESKLDFAQSSDVTDPEPPLSPPWLWSKGIQYIIQNTKKVAWEVGWLVEENSKVSEETKMLNKEKGENNPILLEKHQHSELLLTQEKKNRVC